MAILKCKMCGGDIRATDSTYGTCESCGVTSTLPRADDERLVNLFNRANNLRRQNEFDKAVTAYENILNIDAASAEAHWGLMLSKYGIEYVEDPATGQRLPTCHRVQSDSILTDPDYLSALDNAEDEYTRSLYEAEAKQISEIQKGILAISNKEEPYDVFICYKETTDGGSRTKDSALAQDLYYQLEKEGYKVFFSRISLESKLGQQYEPYIFNALNSAKVMLVIGTKPEHFNAVWVKNEWSRYLALMKNDSTKLLIPCYRDMDAYDLPEEMAMLQSQDMGRIGFAQDIMHGIKKVVDAGKTADTSTTPISTGAATVAPGVESLLKRAYLFLEDGDFKQADEYCERVLDVDPENARAYIGKVLADLELKNEAAFEDYEINITGNTNYNKALRFAKDSYKQTVMQYGEMTRKNEIVKEMRRRTKDWDYSSYGDISEILFELRGYKKADDLLAYMESKIIRYAEASLNNPDIIEKNNAVNALRKTSDIYETNDYIAKLNVQIDDYLENIITEAREIAKQNTLEAIEKSIAHAELCALASSELDELLQELEQKKQELEQKKQLLEQEKRRAAQEETNRIKREMQVQREKDSRKVFIYLAVLIGILLLIVILSFIDF